MLRVLLRPGMIALHAAGIAAVTVATLLGLWQLGSWQDNRRDWISEAAAQPPVPLEELLGPDEAFPRDGVGRPVEFRGTWVPDETVYVEREHEGAQGYWVVTTVAVCADDCTDAAAGDSAIPVVTGWVAGPAQAPTPPSGTTDVAGWLQPGEGEGEFDLDPDDDIIPTVRTADLLERTDRDLYSGYVILDQPASARTGLTAVTPDTLPRPPTFTSVRNLLYALEWWVFAAFAVFLWLRWERDEIRAARTRDEAQDPGEARLPSGA